MPEDPFSAPAGRRASGELEGDVLAVLWSAGRPLTTADVHERVDGDLAYTTVATILGRLHDKGLVERSPVGRTHTYAPAVSEVDLTSSAFRSVLMRSHDRHALLQGLVDSLSPDDEDLLQQLLTRARRARRDASA